ncbi:MAG: rubredoxin [Mesorhizobium sp.]|nr:MAG: rubredoxin [Mesorhizobium sp.]
MEHPMSDDTVPTLDKLIDRNPPYKTWLCVLCGLVYSEKDGWPDDGIPPGTRWADVPEDWACPDCGTSKADFQMTEI